MTEDERRELERVVHEIDTALDLITINIQAFPPLAFAVFIPWIILKILRPIIVWSAKP